LSPLPMCRKAVKRQPDDPWRGRCGGPHIGLAGHLFDTPGGHGYNFDVFLEVKT
jgi:hypothetical protein